MFWKKLDWLVLGKESDNALVQRIFNIHCLLGVLIFLINVFVDAYIHVYWVVRLTTVFYTIVYFLFYYFSRFKGQYKKLAGPLLIVSLSSLNYSWFLLDGVNGGLVIGFILIVVVHSVTFPSKYGYLVPIIVILNYGVLVYINFTFPEWILNQYPTDLDRLIDGISLSFISIFISGFVVVYFRKAYERDRMAIKEKNEELINTEEELRRYTENLSVINRQLEEAKNEAERLHKQKSDFLTTISHEIRTPLNSVIGMSRLLNLENTPEEEKKKLQVMQYSANNLLTLVNDVLDFSKIEVGKIELEEVDVALKKLLDSILNQFQHLIEQKNISLELDYDQTIPEVISIDEVRLKQIMYNLISNSLKFTEEGMVVIKVRLLKQDKNEKTCQLYFEVKDTGIGIDKEKQSQIFKAFEQESIAINRKYGGTGLGLTITKELISLMGGKIELESVENKGSKFFFSLDLKYSDQVTITPEKEQASSTEDEELDLSFLNILVVDDNEMNLQLAEAIFQKWKVNIDITDNGREALEKVKQKEYDFILLDLQMPVMDGYKVAEEILEIEKGKEHKTPIIALTASVQKEVRERAMEIGMTDFLSKPFTHEDLQDMIFKYTRVR